MIPFVLHKRKRNRRGNQEWTIQRNWQHCLHKTQDEDKTKRKYTTPYVLDTTMHKTEKSKIHNTICLGHHYTQTFYHVDNGT